MWIFSFNDICYLPARFACRGIKDPILLLRAKYKTDFEFNLFKLCLYIIMIKRKAIFFQQMPQQMPVSNTTVIFHHTQGKCLKNVTLHRKLSAVTIMINRF